MAKTNATRLGGRQSQAVPIDVDEAEDVKTVSEGQTETASLDHQMDTVIEVKGSTSTVTISLDEKNEEGDQMDSEKETQIITSADVVDSTEEAPIESAEMMEAMQKCEDSQMDIVAGSTATVTVTLDENEEGVSDEVQTQTNGGEQKNTTGKGKRKAPSSVEISPPKKTKLDDGYRLYVGNLNNTKTFDEVKDALANYFMTQSLLVQDIRLDRCKKYAFVDLASEMDLTKGLMLNGNMMHDKPMKIAKAKAPPKAKTVPPSNTLFVTSLPKYVKEIDIKKVFGTAAGITIPHCNGKSKGFAFVKFETVADAEKALQSTQNTKLFNDAVRVNFCQVQAHSEKKKAAKPPNNTLFVSNLPLDVKEATLKKVFGTAVGITIPQFKGKSKGFAFVKFETVADAEKALQSSKNTKLFKGDVGVNFRQIEEKSEKNKLKSKTLVVMGLAEKTTAETLKSAFKGSISANVPVDKTTEASKRFGFVRFESEDNCKAVKEAMDDCEIDGSKVTVAYAEAQLTPEGQLAAPGAAKRKRKKAKKRGAGKPQDAPKEVKMKV